ncbi:YopX family protein [Cohnella sp. GCM10027633]|uniref:YopX family protein n=1 Tax=unclassified Cohnella TaxID=2636738 RepID=UPI00363C444A
MRDIRFRGKRIDNGEWVYGYFVKGATRFCILHSLAVFDAVDVDPDTVGQYTGLKDLNGKEIFDGDVLDISGRPMFIEWNDISAQWAVKSPSGTGYLDMNNDLHEYEVIGNIHDNGDLLK